VFSGHVRQNPSLSRQNIFFPKCSGVRQIIIYPGEDGYWVAECPSLPGCISQGETKQKAIMNIKEAITAYIEAFGYLSQIHI